MSTVLVGALAIGAAAYMIRQVHAGRTRANDPITNSPHPSAAGTQVSSQSGGVRRFDGPAVDVYYGYVRVQAVVSKGKLEKVVVLEHPNDNGTSRYINRVAMPYLIKEAVQTQSANIQLISGATFSSEGFVQSLQSALSKAGV